MTLRNQSGYHAPTLSILINEQRYVVDRESGQAMYATNNNGTKDRNLTYSIKKIWIGLSKMSPSKKKMLL